ncbi:MAG: HAMP domain-containing sensor histidine kinase [Pirellulaceae bacterium]|nr:HAMP domain-containing histidine kinase [Planctomycetales bacterium]
MTSDWPIRRKLWVWAALFAVTLAVLSFSGLRGVHSYRQLARGISQRAAELPHTTALADHVRELRVLLERINSASQSTTNRNASQLDVILLQKDFDRTIGMISDELDSYRNDLRGRGVSDPRFVRTELERETVRKIEQVINEIRLLEDEDVWLPSIGLDDVGMEGAIRDLQQLTNELPTHLQQRMHSFAGDVRIQYRTWIVLTWITSFVAICLLGVLTAMFYQWIVCPLNQLIEGSRRVAAGDFDHRITLSSRDEMADLAKAMNDMTERFQAIYRDLDLQVRERSREVIRSERLSSVGFLAAGVAHEINNPLASIALCAESLERRLHSIIQADDALPDTEHNPDVDVLRNYLRMIQDEAFRCKQITEGLLDFSRMGDVEKVDTDMVELVQNVIDMVGHIGDYKNKHIRFEGSGRVIAKVNAQEMKQVVLNLLTNGLESLELGGTVQVSVGKDLHGTSTGANWSVVIRVKDDGCGIERDVMEHIFEPFFTRRRDGRGTGLGLSITHRIVKDHGGEIQARSSGVGKGSEFIVSLPATVATKKELSHRHKAA